MVNPFEIYRRMRAGGIPLLELELSTVISPEWTEEDESKAAILAIVKNPDKTLVDPIFFTQVALGILGIKPDFEEYESITSDIIEPALELIKLISVENEISFLQMTDDLSGFLAVCLIEEGFYFVENNCVVIQPKLIETAKGAYNVTIPEKDLKECKKLWESSQTQLLDTLPDETSNEHQVLLNRINKDYLKLLTQI